MSRTKHPLFLLFVLLLMHLTLVDACLKYDTETKKCSLCPVGMHLHKGNCLYDISQCLEYLNGADCNKCEKGYKVVKSPDRIECRKLQSQQRKDYSVEEIDPNLPQSPNPADREHFYSFLNYYLTDRYHRDRIECQLVKVVEKMYKTGQNEAIMIYKTSEGTVEKTVAKVIGNYKSFELVQTVLATQTDIKDDQIVIFDPAKLQGKYRPLNVKTDAILEPVRAQQLTTEKIKNSEEIKETSDFNYEYQKPESRDKDIGFQTSNKFLKLTNSKILDEQAKVVGCFVKSSGLRKNYRIFYKTASQEMYEGEVIYDVVKKRAYILNFGKQLTP